MLSPKNFTAEYLSQLRYKTKRDPALLEKAVFAFGLLEALARTNLSFIFKGGSSLTLLLPHPTRLSTDIDIVVPPGTDILDAINRAAVIFPFKRCEEQIRQGKGRIVKRHFKFFYNSPTAEKEFSILLDVLFEENHYRELTKKEIRNELLICEGEKIEVVLPGINGILADKLTAFAPHTTGVPLGGGKELECIKQFYDVATLIENFTSFPIVSDSYFPICQSEIGYRNGTFSPKDVLLDTYTSALCLATRGASNPQEYPCYVKGIHDIRNHIYRLPYTPEIASLEATKVMAFALALFTGTPFHRIEGRGQIESEQLHHIELAKYRGLRSLNVISPQAYSYLLFCDRLLA